MILLGEDFSIAAKDTLYRCLDRLLEHKRELFSFLRERWEDLFGAKFDVSALRSDERIFLKAIRLSRRATSASSATRVTSALIA